jgi:hypothetical protein
MLQNNLLHAPSLLNETGSFTISLSGGGYLGFFFHGDDDFIERSINFCFNYGLLQTGKVFSFHDGSKYILTPTDRLNNGIKQYFINQVIMESSEAISKNFIYDENSAIVDVTWNQDMVETIAMQRVDSFLKTKVEYKNLLEYESENQNNIEYGFGTIGGTETESGSE